MLRDLKYAWRLLCKTPGFSLLTLLTLTIGLSCAIFLAAAGRSFTNGELPFKEPERLAIVQATHDGRETQANSVHYLDYVELAQQQQSFTGLYGLREVSITLSGKQASQQFKGAELPHQIWPMLTLKPLLGRTLQPADQNPGATPVLVIGAQVWQNYLGKDPAVIGSQIKVNGVLRQIVGVMPEGLGMPVKAQIWLPLAQPSARLSRPNERHMGGTNFVLVLGQLKPGIDREQAASDLNRIAANLARSYPKSNHGVGMEVRVYTHWGMQGLAMVYGVLFCAASLLLLLVWVNAGNLLLARANERQQETAIRAALGAPRSYLLRQLLAESLILACAAALLGLFLSAWGLALVDQNLHQSANGQMPFWIQFRLRLPDLLLSLALVVLTTLCTGLLPAWRLSKADIASVLRDGSRASQSHRAGRFSRSLVIAQITLSTTLLVLCVVLSYDIRKSLTADRGFSSSGVLTAEFNPDQTHYRQDKARRAQLWQRLQSALTQQAQGAKIGLIEYLPGSNWSNSTDVRPEGMQMPKNQSPQAGSYAINPDFFAALKVPMLRGRAFNAHDIASSQPVVIVDENFAKQFWPGQNPLGKRLQLDFETIWYTVVGVNRHIVHGNPSANEIGQANLYRPISQANPLQISIALAGSGQPQQWRSALAQAARLADPDVALSNVYDYPQMMAMAASGNDLLLTGSAGLGLLSLLLASSGIYGVSARATTLRSQEIGIRRALGADDRQVLTMLLQGGLLQLALGLGLGLLLAGVFGSLLAGMLFLTDISLWFSMLSVAIILSGVLLLAIWLPTRRAINCSPGAVLRYE